MVRTKEMRENHDEDCLSISEQQSSQCRRWTIAPAIIHARLSKPTVRSDSWKYKGSTVQDPEPVQECDKNRLWKRVCNKVDQIL